MLGGGRSLRRCDGKEPDMYEYSLGCRLRDGIGVISLGGDIDSLRRPGEGVEAADAVSEYVPPSDPPGPYPDDRPASAAAVAAAASSTVPE